MHIVSETSFMGKAFIDVSLGWGWVEFDRLLKIADRSDFIIFVETNYSNVENVAQFQIHCARTSGWRPGYDETVFGMFLVVKLALLENW